MPGLIAAARLHRRQNAHQPRRLASLLQNLFHPLLFAKAPLAAHELDLDFALGSQTFHVLPNGIPQRLRPFGVVENAELVLVENNLSCRSHNTISAPSPG